MVEVVAETTCTQCKARLVNNYVWRRLSHDVRSELLATGHRQGWSRTRCRACAVRARRTGNPAPRLISGDLVASLWEEHRRRNESYNETYRRIAEDLDVPWERIAKSVQRQRKAGLL